MKHAINDTTARELFHLCAEKIRKNEWDVKTCGQKMKEWQRSNVMRSNYTDKA